jgi:glucan phosphoethanolaminetransferase (alkaline phosphatase superfamily)
MENKLTEVNRKRYFKFTVVYGITRFLGNICLLAFKIAIAVLVWGYGCQQTMGEFYSLVMPYIIAILVRVGLVAVLFIATTIISGTARAINSYNNNNTKGIELELENTKNEEPSAESNVQ